MPRTSSQLTFREPNDGECPFDAAMLERGGECHEIDLVALAARVGKADMWEAITRAVLSAMKQWAYEDAERGIQRRYSVWLGEKPGCGKLNEMTRLGFVYVVMHPEADAADEEDDDERDSALCNPFDEVLQRLPEYVRIEQGNPLWDGCRPWYVVDSNTATRVDADAPSYQLIADEVLANFWGGQFRLKQVAGGHAMWGDDDAEMGRGALAYLRCFLRHRHVYSSVSLPGHFGYGKRIPTWLADYFDSGGMLFHTQDFTREQEKALIALTDYPQLLMTAPVGWSMELNESGTHLVYLLVFEDPEGGDLCDEFIYVLASRGHLEELASLVVQDDVDLHVVTADTQGEYVYVGTRTLGIDKNARMTMARLVAPIILVYGPDSQLMPDLSNANVADGEEDEEAVDEPAALPLDGLASLEHKDTRVAAVRLLCNMRDPAYAPAICRAVEKMSWAEVDEVWQELPLLGAAAVEEFVRLTDKPKKKATAACGMRALGRIPCARSLEVLSSLVQTLGSKAEPIEALVELGDYAVPTLLTLSADAKGEVRQMAAYALGKIGALEARDRLVNMAESDRSGKVRDVAKRALAWLDGDEECEIDLRDFYGNLELE